MGGIAMTDFEDPVALTPKQLVSSSKLVKNFGSYLNQTKKRPLFITRGDEIEAVLINIDDYRKLLAEEEEMLDLYNAVTGIRRLVEHISSGRIETAMISMDEVLAEYNLTREDLEKVPDDGLEY